MKKTIIGAAFGAGLLLAAVVPAFATTDCENSWTGAYSNNLCEILAKKKAKIKLYNTANIVNSVTTLTNTGNNSSNMNTGGGTLDTGRAKAKTEVLNAVNENIVAVDQCCDTCDCSGGSGLNQDTGYASNNTVNIDKRKYVKVKIENTANVVNSVTTIANSGDNEQNLNTNAGNLTTGNAISKSIVTTVVNTNDVQISQ